MGFGLQVYADGVSYIAQNLLPRPPDVQSIRKDGKRADFLRWYNQDDQSLVGVDKSTMIANLGSRVTNIDNWDAHGVKFVFRPLSGTSTSLSPLRGTASSRESSKASPLRPSRSCGSRPLSACLLVIFVGQISLMPPPSRGAGKLHHECRRVRRSQHNSLLPVMHSPGEPAGSDTTRKFCITNLDELAEANLAALYKMIILKNTLPNEPAPSSQLRRPALMKLFWILSNQVLVQILCSILSSWPTTWTILV